MSVHAGKPGDAFAFKPWSNGDKGDCESAKAIAAAKKIALPSRFAVAKLVEHDEGDVLFASLSERITESDKTKGARPSRFAVVLAAIQRDVARARLANLPVALAAFEAAEALLSGEHNGINPPLSTPLSSTPLLSLCVYMLMCADTSAAAYDEQCTLQLGVTIGAPDPKNVEMEHMLDGPLGQMALCTVHALHDVWRHHLILQAKAHVRDVIWLTDGCPLAHPTLNTQNMTNREQDLMYSKFAPILRTIVDGLDSRSTIYIADVTGKRPLHQAAFAAHLTEDIDVGNAEDRAPFLLRHSNTVVKVSACWCVICVP